MEVNKKRVLDMLSTALEMEAKGKAFYRKALEGCQNDLGRKIFQQLMEEEVLHMGRIKKIYDSLSAGQPWSDEWKSVGEVKQSITRTFRELADTHGKNIHAETGDLEALSVGIDFELGTVKFYEEQLRLATDTMEKAFIRRMIGEERSHYNTLSDLNLYLSDPDAWFLEKEHLSMDGA